MACALNMASVGSLRATVVQRQIQKTPLLSTSPPHASAKALFSRVSRPHLESHLTRGGTSRPAVRCSAHPHPEQPQPSFPSHSPSAILATLAAASAALLFSSLRRAACKLASLFAPITAAEQVRIQSWGLNRMKLAGAMGPLCFAAIGQAADSASSSTPLTVIASGMAKWLELYSGLLLIRVLLSWFPNIDWERQPLQAIRDMSDPYLNLFRNIMPPFFGALDLSPMLAFLVLGMLTSLLNTTIYA